MRLIYMIAADVLKALGWEVGINEKDSYWNLVLTNTTSSEDMPESHKSCLRGLLRGWLMEFNYEVGRQCGVFHYRLFCDPAWEPLKPRGEVYTREFTEVGWKSFSELHQL